MSSWLLFSPSILFILSHWTFLRVVSLLPSSWAYCLQNKAIVPFRKAKDWTSSHSFPTLSVMHFHNKISIKILRQRGKHSLRLLRQHFHEIVETFRFRLSNTRTRNPSAGLRSCWSEIFNYLMETTFLVSRSLTRIESEWVDEKV